MPISVSDLLGEFRTYRMGLIQTYQQYKFAFQAIIDHIKQSPKIDKDTENDKSKLNNNESNDEDENSEDSDESEDAEDEDSDDDNGNESFSKKSRPSASIYKNSKRIKTSNKDTKSFAKNKSLIKKLLKIRKFKRTFLLRRPKKVQKV
jgi:hypothetical protein